MLVIHRFQPTASYQRVDRPDSCRTSSRQHRCVDTATAGDSNAAGRPATSCRHAPAGQRRRQAARAGGGGGRGNAAATLFTDDCAPCHGTDLAGGRAPSLFAERFLSTNDDDTIFAKISDGVPNTAMVPFKDTLDRAADLATRRLPPDAGGEPQGQAGLRPGSEQPGHQVREADLQDRSRGAGARDAVGIRLPARRPAARHRAARAASGSSTRGSCSRAGEGHAEGVGTPGLAACSTSPFIRSTRRTAGSIWRTRKSSPGYVAPPPPPPAPTRPIRPRRRSRTRRGGRGGAPSPPSMTVFVRGKINKNNEWVERAAPLSRAGRALHAERLALRHALHVRQGRAISSTRLGERGDDDERAGSVQPARQDPSRQRRRHDSERQPVRQHAERAAVHLVVRPSQSAGPVVGSGHRPALGIRARSDRR